MTGGTYNFRKYLDYVGAESPFPASQLRYMYFIDPKCRKRLTVPEIPSSRIDELGAGMYKGEKVTQAARHAILTRRRMRMGRAKDIVLKVTRPSPPIPL